MYKRQGLDTHKHRRSLNVLVIGGSGAAKTRGYVKPNILEANSNYVITDPKMEVLTATGAVSYTHLDVYKRQAQVDGHVVVGIDGVNVQFLLLDTLQVIGGIVHALSLIHISSSVRR